METGNPKPDKLCVHTITTKKWTLGEAVDAYSAEGIRGISVWQDAAAQAGIGTSRRILEASDLEVVSYVRGGFFPSSSSSARLAAIDNNRRMLDEAAELGAPLLVMVCGADPKISLAHAREQIQLGLEAIMPFAEALGIKLGIEPLHPMYADTRSAINTLGTANDLAAAIDHPLCGVVIDVYHLWWDPALEVEIIRCGRKGKLFAYHICDWRVPTTDLLNDRGLMGEGCIPLKEIRHWVQKAGFDGYHEVEIFSERHWARDPYEFLKDVVYAYHHHS